MGDAARASYDALAREHERVSRELGEVRDRQAAAAMDRQRASEELESVLRRLRGTT